jgi:hypothetical protein
VSPSFFAWVCAIAGVAIDLSVLNSAVLGVRSAVLCNTLIYCHGALPRLIKQARKSGVVRHVARGLNIWSNVHINEVTDLYLLALEKTLASMF